MYKQLFSARTTVSTLFLRDCQPGQFKHAVVCKRKLFQSKEPKKPQTLREPLADEPIKYSKSPAVLHDSVELFFPKYRSKLEFLGIEKPPYQTPVLIACAVVLLVYIIRFREGNEWDDRSSKAVYLAFPEMEEHDLKYKIRSRKALGLDCTIETFELQELKRKKIRN